MPTSKFQQAAAPTAPAAGTPGCAIPVTLSYEESGVEVLLTESGAHPCSALLLTVRLPASAGELQVSCLTQGVDSSSPQWRRFAFARSACLTVGQWLSYADSLAPDRPEAWPSTWLAPLVQSLAERGSEQCNAPEALGVVPVHLH